ncbi:SAM-dependent methyltransferase [Luteibacter sp. Sphag1AF]|uniref:methyltransferase domain-containing protein n=1 Tax=Luteibacter sp. Sphag1AF TaxID=2587031 RepID=UPI00161C917F|nr:methyltransferase domain-containing protein [Luteibacter sp. Sphag1AF]MBB3226881.1 SAM-dependent methyltransferase [Luteibacter sp. Sphag1AF]
MPKFEPDIYSSAPLKALFADEAVALSPVLARCTGEHGLHLLPAVAAEPPPLPLLGHWASVQVQGTRLGGDIQASGLEPLPFADDAFGVVLLRHALEVSARPSALLAEAIRVLEPGGTLAIAGVHPLGPWSPWVHWRGGAAPPRLTWPWWWRQRLASDDMKLEPVRRIGHFLPRSDSTRVGESVFGGGYVVIARKSRPSTVPLRPRLAAVPTPMPGSLASGARRNAR